MTGRATHESSGSTPSRENGDSPSAPLVAVVAAFVLSRVGYYLAGIRFDVSSLPWFWQFIDPALLRENLGQSLWYLHSQPPAFNLFLGLVVNLFPGHETAVFTVCYLFLGLTFTVTLFLLLRSLSVSGVLSAVVTAVYVASPACVLYENWLFYTYPLTALLLLAALLWHRFATRGRFLDALLFLAAAALLALTWSLFHLIWVAALVVVVLLRKWGLSRAWSAQGDCPHFRTRNILAAASIPLLVVLLWYGKNLVLFGQFTGSTWFGLNFSKMTNSMLTVVERKALYDNGTIGAVSLVPPFSSLDRYEKAGTVPDCGRAARPGTVPVLDQEVKPSGIPNFNHRAYVAISQQYGRDAFRILANRPSAYLRGLAESYLLFFLPSSAYLFLAGSAERIAALDRFYNVLFNGRFVYHHDRGLRASQPARYYLQALLNTGWFVIIAYAVVLIAGLALLFRPGLLPALRSSLLFLWFNIAWMAFVANGLEVGENNRFRFVTDPLVVTFLACLAVNWLARRSSGTTRSQGPTPNHGGKRR